MVEDMWEMLRGRGESKEKDKSGMPKWADSLSYNGRDQVVYPILCGEVDHDILPR
jgi:hypothetical protein